MADDKKSEAKLSEISREAHKLTQMIHSWPKTQNFGSRLKDTTKDLMNGAFYLQESLIALEKMSINKEKMDLDYTEGSRRFERLAMDGSLFNYIDELKRVIRESTYSQRCGIVSEDDEKVSSSRTLGLFMKKAKGPSLIAKLMGLEELPSCSNNPAIKESKDDECLVQRRSILALEIPTARVLTSREEKQEPRTERAVKDIVEVVKSKAVLESNEIKKDKRMRCSVPRRDSKVPTYVTNAQSDRILVLKKTQATNPIPEEVVCHNQKMFSRKPERNETRNVRKNMVISYHTTANFASIDQQQQKRKKRKVLSSTGVKGNASSKKLMNGRKTEVRKEMKIVASPKSQAKLVTRTPAKSDKRSSIRKDISTNDQLKICKGPIASKMHNETSTIKSMPQKFPNVVKAEKATEGKPVRKSMDIKAVVGNMNCKDVNRSFNLPFDARAKQVEQNSRPYGKEHRTSAESKLSCQVKVKSTEVDRSSSSSKESVKLLKNKANLQTEAKEQVDVQPLLWSSQCFLSHARELFGLDGSQAANHLRTKTRNANLLLDCAKEFMVRKKHEIELSTHQMHQTGLGSIAVVSVDQLVHEISCGIGKLSSYSKNVIGVTFKDGFYGKLEKDLRCKDVMLNAMWDVGWVNWICVEEVDTFVGQVEELILYGLVEELVGELSLRDSSVWLCS